MPTPSGLAQLAKKRLFWLITHIAFPCYRMFPIFGRLRASLGVIRSGSRVLVIRRNDGRGLGFPGGLAYPWETDEQALTREVQEETGLRVTSCEFAFRYDSMGEIPVRIAVYQTQAEGKLDDSWEGTPEWVELAEVQRAILKSQRYAVEQLLRRGSELPMDESKNTNRDG